MPLQYVHVHSSQVSEILIAVAIVALFLALLVLLILVIIFHRIVSRLDVSPTDDVARTVGGARDGAHLFEQRLQIPLVEASLAGHAHCVGDVVHAAKCAAERSIKAVDVTSLANKMLCP